MNNSFQELLEKSGARPARYGRKWHCPRCPERSSPALSVDWTLERYFCHRCQAGGGPRTLENELGIGPQRFTRAEWATKRAINAQAERLHRQWREDLNFHREFLWLLNEIERACVAIAKDCTDHGEELPAWVLPELARTHDQREQIEAVYATLSDPQRQMAAVLEILGVDSPTREAA